MIFITIIVLALTLMYCVIVHQCKKCTGNYDEAPYLFIRLWREEPSLAFRIFLANCIFTGFIFLVDHLVGVIVRHL